MKQEIAGEIRWKSALWISWLSILAVFAFGAAVDVEFVDPSVSLSEAWQSASLSHMTGVHHQREYVEIFFVSVAAVLLYTFLPSSKLRLGALAAGFVTPVLVMGPVALGVMFISPWMVGSLPIAPADGEFYEEGLLMFAACGLWMLVCLVFSTREALKLWRSRAATALMRKSPAA